MGSCVYMVGLIPSHFLLDKNSHYKMILLEKKYLINE